MLDGIAGNYIAEQLEVAQKDRWRYVVAGAATGAALGVIGGTYAAPSIAASTGIGGISVTSAGITTVPLASAGASGFEQARQLSAAQSINQNAINKYALGLRDKVRAFADTIGAKHYMDHEEWRNKVLDAILDKSGQIHVILDGIDQTPMNMILNYGRGGLNWELHLLYQYKDVFEKTLFYYQGEILTGYEIFKITL